MVRSCWVLIASLIASVALAQPNPGPSSRGDLFKSRQYQTYGPTLNLFVDSTGSDANACTASGTAACVTFQGALGKIPKNVRSAVLVTVGLGNFTGAFVEGFQLINDLNATSTGVYLEFDGTLQNFAPATGTATGTATGGTVGSGTAFGTLVDTGQTWTANDLRGRLIQITGGTGSGQVFPIQSNTGTTITISGAWTAPTGTSTYAVQDWGTVINAGVVRPRVSTNTAAGATQAGFRIGANGLAQEQINFKWLKFTTANALDIRSDGLVVARGIRTETTSTAFVLGGSGQITVQASAVVLASSTTGFSVAVGTKFVNSINNLFDYPSDSNAGSYIYILGTLANSTGLASGSATGTATAGSMSKPVAAIATAIGVALLGALALAPDAEPAPVPVPVVTPGHTGEPPFTCPSGIQVWTKPNNDC